MFNNVYIDTEITKNEVEDTNILFTKVFVLGTWCNGLIPSTKTLLFKVFVLPKTVLCEDINDTFSQL